MKINEETTVSEEQVLFNKLNWENQQMILRIIRCLQPCELSCKIEEEKKIPEKINTFEELTKIPANFEFNDIILADKLNEIIDYLDYLKSKGE